MNPTCHSKQEDYIKLRLQYLQGSWREISGERNAEEKNVFKIISFTNSFFSSYNASPRKRKNTFLKNGYYRALN